MNSLLFYIIVYCPESATDAVRNAAAEAGAGKLGNYDSCSFSSKGTGRFRPLEGASPTIGSIGMLEEVAEEKIELVVTEAALKRVLAAIKQAHPYEEPAMVVLKMEDYKDLL